jgi:hypothetical protein
VRVSYVIERVLHIKQEIGRRTSEENEYVVVDLKGT